MKKEIKIQATEYSPYVELRPGFCKIQGRAILEDSINFFAPVMEWLGQYVQDPEDETTVIIDMCVYDSAVSRRFIDFFNYFEKIVKQRKKVKVIWYYDPDDSLNLQKAYEFSTVYNLEFDFIERETYGED